MKTNEINILQQFIINNKAKNILEATGIVSGSSSLEVAISKLKERIIEENPSFTPSANTRIKMDMVYLEQLNILSKALDLVKQMNTKDALKVYSTAMSKVMKLDEDIAILSTTFNCQLAEQEAALLDQVAFNNSIEDVFNFEGTSQSNDQGYNSELNYDQESLGENDGIIKVIDEIKEHYCYLANSVTIANLANKSATVTVPVTIKSSSREIEMGV